MDLQFHIRFWPIFIISAVAIVISLLVVGQSGSQDFEGMPFPQMPHDMSDPNHWYPSECCSMRDCYPLDPSEYKEEKGGFSILPSKEFIPDNETRISKDGRVHRCSIGADRSGPTIGHKEHGPFSGSSYLGGACLFIPPKSF